MELDAIYCSRHGRIFKVFQILVYKHYLKNRFIKNQILDKQNNDHGYMIQVILLHFSHN